MDSPATSGGRPGSVKGHVAIVTGGSRGIGEATARLLVAEGARVLIADLLDEQGHALAAHLGVQNAAYAHLDVRSPDEWDTVVRACQQTFGPPTILVNNAGVMVTAPIEESTVDQFRHAFDVNMLGPFLGVRTVAPLMRTAGGGAIVVVSSAGGREGTPGMALYAASKAANANFAQSAALELASAGIRVNVVAPGLVDTDMSRPVMPPEALGPSATLGVPQVGRPRDIAAAIVHLVSDDSPFTTGTVFNVDGGYLAGHARLNPAALNSET